MEEVNNPTWRQIITHFFQNNQSKGKPYTIEYFLKLHITFRQINGVVRIFESGESHKQQKGAEIPQIKSRRQERKVTKDIEIENRPSMRVTGEKRSVSHMTVRKLES